MTKKPESPQKTDPAIVAALIGGAVTIIVTLIVVFGDRLFVPAPTPFPSATIQLTSTITPFQTPTPTITPKIIQTADLQYQVGKILQDQESLQTQVAELSNAEKRLDLLESRLQEIEQVVQENPSEAMAYVILRRDLDSAREQIAILRDELQAARNQNLPLFGLVATVGFAVFAILRSIGGKQISSQTQEQPDEL